LAVDAAAADRIRIEPAANLPQRAARFELVLMARRTNEFVSLIAPVFA
jgi:hypothetical protein